MKHPTLFSSPFVPFLLSQVAQRGMNPSALVQRFGIDGETMPLDQVTPFVDAVMAGVKDETFLLRLGLELPRGAYGAVEFVWRTAPDVRTAGEVMERYASFISALFRPEVRAASPGRVRLVWPSSFSLGRHVREFVLAAGLKLLHELTAHAITIWRIGFGVAAPRNAADVERLLGAPVVWEQQEDWVEFDEHELERKTATADPALFKVLCGLLDRLRVELERPRDVRSQVEAVVARKLHEGEPAVRTIASALKISARTLQRRLEAEHTSVRGIVDDVRRQKAELLIADEKVPLSEVAWRLGFSQFSAFARAFKRWHGRSPGAARAALR